MSWHSLDEQSILIGGSFSGSARAPDQIHVLILGESAEAVRPHFEETVYGPLTP